MLKRMLVALTGAVIGALVLGEAQSAYAITPGQAVAVLSKPPRPKGVNPGQLDLSKPASVTGLVAIF